LNARQDAAQASSREVFERLTVGFDKNGILRTWALADQDGALYREPAVNSDTR
jgi:hypothetical protein